MGFVYQDLLVDSPSTSCTGIRSFKTRKTTIYSIAMGYHGRTPCKRTSAICYVPWNLLCFAPLALCKRTGGWFYKRIPCVKFLYRRGGNVPTGGTIIIEDCFALICMSDSHRIVSERSIR